MAGGVEGVGVVGVLEAGEDRVPLLEDVGVLLGGGRKAEVGRVRVGTFLKVL